MLLRMGIEPNGSLAGKDASAGGDKIESTSAVDHAAATTPKASMFEEELNIIAR